MSPAKSQDGPVNAAEDGPEAQLIPLSAPPLADLPLWGRRFEFDQCFVELVPQGERVFNVRLNDTFASINFGPAEGTSSLAGDRLRRYKRRPYEYIVVPARFPLKGEAAIAPEVLAFVFRFDMLRDTLSRIAGVCPTRILPQVVIGNPSPFITALAKKIRGHMSQHNWSHGYLKSLCTVILTEMCRPIATNRGARRRSPLGKAKFDLLLKYIDGNLDGDLAVDKLADLVGASPDQLSRAFKRSLGETPHNYILQRRTDAARVLMRDRSATLAQIAYATGFSSQSHMTTAFKKVLGVTPGAVREQIQESAASGGQSAEI